MRLRIKIADQTKLWSLKYCFELFESIKINSELGTEHETLHFWQGGFLSVHSSWAQSKAN